MPTTTKTRTKPTNNNLQVVVTPLKQHLTILTSSVLAKPSTFIWQGFTIWLDKLSKRSPKMREIRWKIITSIKTGSILTNLTLHSMRVLSMTSLSHPLRKLNKRDKTLFNKSKNRIQLQLMI